MYEDGDCICVDCCGTPEPEWDLSEDDPDYLTTDCE